VRRGRLDRSPLAAAVLVTIVDTAFAAFTATQVLRPATPPPPWTDSVIVIGALLGCGTLVVYVVSRARIAADRRPALAAIAALGWAAVFVAGLGPFGTPPPWWFGPHVSGWLSQVYDLGLLQACGLALVMVGILDAGVLTRRVYGNRA